MTTMPVQKPGKSVQDVGTPLWLLELVAKTWGTIVLDVAASERYHAAYAWYGEEHDGLTQPWRVLGPVVDPVMEGVQSRKLVGTIWCNPPFGCIKPWIKKASEYIGPCVVAVLVPAAVGSNWWAEYVDKQAQVLFLRPRLIFQGHDQPYPKDCALLIYGAGKPGYRCVKALPGWLQSGQEQADA